MIKEKSIQERVRKYMAENEIILQKYGLGQRLIINFPNRKKIPFRSRMALRRIGKQGGILDIQFGERNKK